jgi:NDP-sugar pyrophosphorylase family protein
MDVAQPPAGNGVPVDLTDWTVALLAGGLATRLRPITETIPKALVTVAGEPFLAHQLRLLHRHGFRHVVACVGHLGERIQADFGDGGAFGMQLEYAFDGEKLLGTGGAIKRALPRLGNAFVVLYGDSYLPMDYAAAVRRFVESGQPGLMSVFHNEGKWDTSNVVFADGTIRRYDKKELTPEMRHIDYGLGILRAEALAPYPADAPFDLAEVYRDLSRAGKLAGYEVRHRFYEIGSHTGLAELDALLRNGKVRSLPDDAAN